jgi:hypothetical protein
MGQSLAESVLALLVDFITPLEAAAKDERARRALFASLGHTPSVSSDPGLVAMLNGVSTLSTQLSSVDPSTLDSWAGVQKLLSLAQQVDALVDGFEQIANDPNLAAVAASLAEEIAALLLASWLRRNHETVFSVLAFLTLINRREAIPLNPGVVQGDTTLRNAYLLDEFEFSRIGDLASNPGDTLLTWYLPNGMQTGADAQLSASRLFPYLASLASAIGIPWDTRPTGNPVPPTSDFVDGDSGQPTDETPTDNEPPDDAADSGVIDLPTAPPDDYYTTFFPTFSLVPYRDATTELSIDFRPSSALHTGAAAGLLIGFTGTFNQTATQGQWKLTFTSEGDLPALLLDTKGFHSLLGDGALTGGNAKLLVDYVPPAGSFGPAFVFGSATGTRLELGTAELTIGFTWTEAGGVDALAGLSAKSCSIVIAPGDGDSFLSSVLPANGLTAKFDLGLTWSSGTGFAFNGAAGLDATLPVGISIGGVVQIPSVHIGLAASSTALQSELSLGISFSIGPLQAVVDRIGLVSSLNFPSGGAPGLSDLSFSFKPPSGVGLSVDSAGVSGGGFLGFDPAKHEYTGILQLQFNDLALQAFGIITTQVAGSDGYSLIALVDADFPPIDLGLGFTLDGVGGLLAVHRTAAIDVLRTAMKAGQLSTILFPKNAITNAAQILAMLDVLFPTAAGRFLFGPMALIGWGTPTVLTASIAVILELPEPIEIILLGVIEANFPTPSAPLVKLKMDALGVIDFSKDELSLDATLFDSKLISFTISGDMALRANWSSQGEFLLAIGGFHPQFTPPPVFPTLKRITIDMPSGIVSKLRLAAYLAVTSNSLQFGAALDVFIGVSGFGLAGHLGFDALLQLKPFHFEADISGSIALTAGSDDLMSVSLDATLTGPAPWNIAGKFKVHIVFFDVHISFSQTWGQDAPSQQISTIDVGALLSAMLADPGSWNVQLPTGLSALVSTRAVEDSTVVFAHPLARVGVHERLVPLDLVITRFGEATPSGATTFSITKFQVGSATVNYDAVQDQFAPAQFFDLSDTDKLSRPSFELHNAGVVMSGSLVTNSAPVSKTIDYETYFIDTPGDLRVDEGVPQSFPWGDIVVVMLTGAAAQKPISRAGNRRYTAPGNPIKVADPAFALVDTTSLTSQAAVPAGKTTYSDVDALLAGALASSPAQRDNLQIVATHELVTA